MTDAAAQAGQTDQADLTELAALYRDLHAHPELSFAEFRTADIVESRLTNLGYAPLPPALVSGGLQQAAHIPGHGPIPSPAQCH